MESSRSVALTVADLVIWHHVLLAGLSLMTVLFLGLFIQEMRRGRAPMIESNWGGIGGGGGGWRMSSSLAYLLGMLGMATLLAIIVHVEDSKSPTTEKKSTDATPTPVAKTTATPTPAPVSTPSPPAATPSSSKASPSP